MCTKEITIPHLKYRYISTICYQQKYPTIPNLLTVMQHYQATKDEIKTKQKTLAEYHQYNNAKQAKKVKQT